MSVKRGIAQIGLDAVGTLVDASVVVVLRTTALAAFFMVHVATVVIFVLAALAVVV